MSVTAALAAGSVALPVLLALALQGRRRRRDSALLAKRYGGRVSLLGDAVRFEYKGAQWEVQRLASGRGLGDTGFHTSLVLNLDQAEPLVIGPAAAMKYLYALSVPREHNVLRATLARLHVVGPAHASVAAALDTPAWAPVLEGLFSRHYSTLRAGRDLRFAGPGLPRWQWTLRLTGLPKEIYEQPDVLKQFLDNIILLCGTIDFRIHRRVRFA